MNQKKIQMIFSSGMISSINVFQLEQRNPYSIIYNLLGRDSSQTSFFFRIAVKFLLEIPSTVDVDPKAEPLLLAIISREAENTWGWHVPYICFLVEQKTADSPRIVNADFVWPRKNEMNISLAVVCFAVRTVADFTTRRTFEAMTCFWITSWNQTPSVFDALGEKFHGKWASQQWITTIVCIVLNWEVLNSEGVLFLVLVINFAVGYDRPFAGICKIISISLFLYSICFYWLICFKRSQEKRLWSADTLGVD